MIAGKIQTSFDPVVLSGYSSRRNAEIFAKALGAELVPLDHRLHPNGEIKTVLGNKANLRNGDAIILASAAGTPDRIIKETKSLQQLALDGQAGSVTTVLPYQFYGRQDSKHGEKAPIEMRITLSELCHRTDRLFIFDPHNPSGTALALQSEDVRYDPIHFAYIFAKQTEALINSGVITRATTQVWGLDKGGVERLPENYLDCFRGIGLAVPETAKALPFLDKQRDHSGKVRFTGRAINFSARDTAMQSEGRPLEGIDIILAEDMVDTGGSVVDAGELLKKLGARSITLFATNGIFSKPRDARVRSEGIDRINASAAHGNGIDAIFVIRNFDHALTNQRLARAIEHSPVIHEIDGMPFAAEIVRAAHNPDRATNSVSRRLGGDAALMNGGEGLFRPACLKRNSPLLALAKG